MSADLPAGWEMRESKSHPGKFYYFNPSTGESSWEVPATSLGKVRVRHILRKHSGSRRPASWRNPDIRQSKEEAIAQIQEIRQSLLDTQSAKGYDAMHTLFQEIASKDSDCGSAQRGGGTMFHSPTSPFHSFYIRILFIFESQYSRRSVYHMKYPM